MNVPIAVDIDEELVTTTPSEGNVSISGTPDYGAYKTGTWEEDVNFQQRYCRQKTMRANNE